MLEPITNMLYTIFLNLYFKSNTMTSIIKSFITIFILTSLYGCTTITQVRDYDGELSTEEELEIFNNGGVEYTGGMVMLGDYGGVFVTAIKNSPLLTFDKDYELKQDIWEMIVTNGEDEAQCVAIYWKLMDFKFISEYPNPFYIKAHDMLHLGDMIQQVWEIEGVKMTLPPSGYIHWMGVKEPVENAKIGEECLFMDKEEDIIER